ncbi:MAG: ABC transporter ATP-binding protein [Phycisphaerae bacterium]|nr:ABC transporter ATP-binding protein [Phycisphaerae bacterium]
MKYFFQSLRYLKPYRVRLGVSFFLILCIAVLWGGGLGMLLPGMKVLLSEEGLHGWAWNSMTQDRLDAKIVYRLVPKDQKIGEDCFLPRVLDVISEDNDGRAAEGKIQVNEWLVGLETEGRREYLQADQLARRLAQWDEESGRIAHLLVYNPETKNDRVAPVKLHRIRFGSRLLGQIAARLPEPVDKKGRIPILIWLLVVAFILTLLRNILRVFQEYLVETAVLKGSWDLREECYTSALRQPVTYFAKEGTTDTMSRFVQDSTELSRAQVTLFGKTMVEPAKAVASVVLAFYLSWQFTLIAVIAGPFAVYAIRLFGKAIRRSTKKALESWAELLAVLEETLTGIRVVKSFTMEAAERKRFHRVNRALYKQQRRMARTDAATSPAVEALGITTALVAVGGAAYWVLSGYMDPELFIAWMASLIAAFDPVRKLSKVATRFQRGDAAAERLFELRNRPKEKRTPGAPMLPRHKTSIEFIHVGYRYPGTEENVLRDVNLKIQAGKTIAVVGPNGSGKTTLVSLLPRLLELTEGKILLDGLDISTHSIRSLRRQIAVVTQETVIFNATIGENIAYGQRRAHPETVLEAAKKAYVDEFVRELPDGYDTMVGQHGATLSGGQRQRIAIARAIVRDPAILIFDEALSQIDADSEQKIHRAMEEFIQDRTTFMIAHRFSTVQSADKIVVLNEGQIVDVGAHEELMRRCELYKHLYNTQFGGERMTNE